MRPAFHIKGNVEKPKDKSGIFFKGILNGWMPLTNWHIYLQLVYNISVESSLNIMFGKIF